VERYLEKLATRLGCHYLGTIVRGNGEGARWMPEGYRPFLSLQEIGRTWAESGVLDEEQLRAFAKPERFPRILAPLFRVFLKTKVAQGYWNKQLEENGAYEERFARPYE
jgi:hypothetical protein